MSEPPIDLMTRQAAHGISRRTSLTSLGAAVIGMALTAPAPAAGKQGKHCRKSCRKKRRKQCRKEKKQCRRAVREICEPFPATEECHALILPCCATCKVADTLRCIIEVSESQ